MHLESVVSVGVAGVGGRKLGGCSAGQCASSAVGTEVAIGAHCKTARLIS